MAEDEESSENYAAKLAEAAKDRGNVLFAAKDFAGAVAAYSEAIALDPDNKILHSNRSGAYISNLEPSKALWDAQKCVALADGWPKSHSRLGAAQHALGRYVDAQASYRTALALDDGNSSFVAGLKAARDGEERAVKQRAAEAAARKLAEEAAERKAVVDAAKQREAEREALEAGRMDDFFSALQDDVEIRRREKRAETNPITEKYKTQKLATAAEHIARLTAKHAAFRNLDCYRVLVLDVDATPDDLKMRYRKLSTLCHPDKNLGDEHARDAFEAIKTAYELLLDPKKRDRQILVIEGARERAKKERKFKLDKGLDPETLPSEEECFDREVLKTFAQNEMKRRDVEDHNRVQAQREREHEEVATKKVDDEKKFEEQWNQDGRRGDRVDFWQQFQDDDERAGGQKRLRTAKQFKQQTHDVKKKKHGEADMEGWKKEWK